MRKINYIVVHCSATKAEQKVTVADIEKWHKARGFTKIGYHYVIYNDGSLHTGRELAEIGAHVSGYNANSIGICYTGGLDAQGKPADTRTAAQKKTLLLLLKELKAYFQSAAICGHRDFSKDKNGNGLIEPFEWLKACPCFDAKIEYKTL
jgi:N-acetyl-anhydromuramyl-L-alanine amidase AmpD